MINVKIFSIVFMLLFVVSFSMAQGVAINTDGATADGSAMLDVKSTGSGMLIPRMTLAQRNSLTLPAHSLLIYQTDNTPGYYYNSGTPASPVWVRLGAGGGVIICSNANQVIKSNGTDGVCSQIFDNGTNVGIATTSPVAKLEIRQNMSNYPTSFTGAHLNLGAGNTVDNTGFVGITFDASTADNYGWSAGALRSSGGQSDFVWKHHNNSSAGTEWMRITSTGNVGIGTTTPAYKLDVNGYLRVNSTSNPGRDYRIQCGSRQEVYTANDLTEYINGNKCVITGYSGGANNDFYIASVAEGTKYFTAEGTNQRIGIGTISPSAQLHTTGTVRFASLTNGFLRVDGSGNVGVTDASGLFTVGTGLSWSGSTLNSLWTASGNNIYNNNSGNVGIGTTNPATKLHVAGGVRVGNGFNVNVPNSCGGNWVSNADMAIWTADHTGGCGDEAYIAHYIRSGEGTTLEIGNKNDGDDHIALMPSGNVGIGTTTPGYRLDLAGGTFGFGNSNQRTEWRDNAGLQGNAGAQSGFFETYNPVNYPAGATDWWHLIDVRHNNTGNNYAMQFAGSFYDQKLYFRKTNDNAAQAWTEVITNSSLNADITIDYSTSSITTNASWQNIPGLERTIYLNAGDRVFIDASGAIMVPTYWTSADIGISVNNNDLPNGGYTKVSVDATSIRKFLRT